MRMTSMTALLIAFASIACSDRTLLEPDPLTRLDLRPTADTLFVPGETTLVVPVPTFGPQGLTRDLTVTWQSSDTAVFTVDAGGVVKAVANGSATVIARAEGVEGRATITVSFGPMLATVRFADAKLAACVAELRLTYANEVRELRCPDRGIVSLEGSEILKRIRLLDLGSVSAANRNSIRDLRPLSSLQLLHTLDLAGNGLTDIRPLASLRYLNSLDLTFNEITDISALSTHTFMRFLYLDRNRISDLRPLATLTELIWLGVGTNSIIDVGPLASLVKLDLLVLSANQIVTISPLRSLTALRQIDLTGNRINDLTPLSALTNLNSITLSRNPIAASALVSLHSLPLLTALSLNEVTLNDASQLAGLTRLQWLSVTRSGLRDITGLGALTALRSLYLDDNLIADVRPLGSLTELQILWLQRNRISTGVAALTTLTKAREIQLSGNTAIRCPELTALSNALGSSVVRTSSACLP